MDKTLLLRAVDSIVGAVEVRDQHAAEAFQQLMQKVTFAIEAVEVDHRIQTCKYPNIALALLELYLRLIHMQERPSEYTVENLLHRLGIHLRHQRFEHKDLSRKDANAEEFLNHLG